MGEQDREPGWVSYLAMTLAVVDHVAAGWAAGNVVMLVVVGLTACVASGDIVLGGVIFTTAH